METPLAMLPQGSSVKVVRIVGGKGITRRLVEMGFIPGEKVKILHSDFSGPILVSVKDSKVALGRGIAMKIVVDGLSE